MPAILGFAAKLSYSSSYPYPGFYLGIPGKALQAKTWVDLRGMDDFDAVDFSERLRQGRITQVLTHPPASLTALIDCVAAADDTTKLQERILRDLLSVIRS